MALASGNVRLTITRALRLNYTRRLKKNRLLDFPFYHTLILLEEKNDRIYLCCLYLWNYSNWNFTFWNEQVHILRGKTCRSISSRTHIWYLMQTFAPKIDPASICSLTGPPLPEHPPTPRVTCVWLNSLRGTELSKWRSDYGGVRVNTAVHKRVIIGAHRGVIMRAVSAAPPRVKGARKRLWCCLYFHLKN